MSVSGMISIVIPVSNDQQNLDRILLEFEANQSAPNWELIVVDDGSTVALTLGKSPPENWQIIRHEHQKGAAAARNSGAQKARGEYLVLLSVFLRIPADYIVRLQRFVHEHQFDYAQHLLERAPDIPANRFQVFISDQKERLTQPGETLPIKQSLFTAAVIPKEVFWQAKGFDESMRHYGGHEMDLVYRLDLAGYKQRIIIKNFPLQRVQLGTHSTVRKRLKEYGQTGLPNLLKKHPALEKTILVHPRVWDILSFLGLTRLAESILYKKIEKDKALGIATYRLYLHLMMRNAWDAR